MLAADLEQLTTWSPPGENDANYCYLRVHIFSAEVYLLSGRRRPVVLIPPARKALLYLDLEQALAESLARLEFSQLLCSVHYGALDVFTRNMIAARRVRILESLVTRKIPHRPALQYSNKFRDGAEPTLCVRSAETEFGRERFVEKRREREEAARAAAAQAAGTPSPTRGRRPSAVARAADGGASRSSNAAARFGREPGVAV